MRADRAGTPRDIVWEKMLTARMNVLYYERRFRLLSGWDLGLRVTSALMASAGVVAALQWTNMKWLAVLAGLLAGAASAATLVLRLNEKTQTAGMLLPMFVKAHAALERTFEQSDETLTHEQIAGPLALFDEAETLEAEKAPGASVRARDKAQRAVFKEIGRDDLATA